MRTGGPSLRQVDFAPTPEEVRYVGTKCAAAAGGQCQCPYVSRYGSIASKSCGHFLSFFGPFGPLGPFGPYLDKVYDTIYGV